MNDYVNPDVHFLRHVIMVITATQDYLEEKIVEDEISQEMQEAVAEQLLRFCYNILPILNEHLTRLCFWEIIWQNGEYRKEHFKGGEEEDE